MDIEIEKVEHVDIRGGSDRVYRCTPAWRVHIDDELHPSLYVRQTNIDGRIHYIPTCGISGLALEPPDELRCTPDDDTPLAAALRGLAAIEAYPGYEVRARAREITGDGRIYAVQAGPGSWRWPGSGGD